MLMRRAAAAIILLVSTTLAFARGGGGGYVTAFDPNWFGGPQNVACFRTLASGVCAGKASAHYSNAACNGGNDDAALADWITYASALNTLAVLYTGPPGSSCVFTVNQSFVSDNTVPCPGFGGSGIPNVKNAVIWGRGVNLSVAWLGGLGIYYGVDPNNGGTCTGAPINTMINLTAQANAGDTTFMISPANTANLTVGDWGIMTAVGNTLIGNSPPSHYYHEHILITAINAGTGVVTFSPPLNNTYKITYPDIGGTGPYQGGPATFYLMRKTWDTNAEFVGFNIAGTQLTNVIGRTIVMRDVTWTDPAASGPSPSVSGNVWMIGGSSFSSEVDKDNDFYGIIKSNPGRVIIQSSSINEMTIWGSSFSRGISLTPGRTTITNTTASFLKPGAQFGQSQTLTLNGVTYTTAGTLYHFSPISSYTLDTATGILTIPKASTEWINNALSMWVPGGNYFMGDTDGSNTCSISGPRNFTVSNLDELAGNVRIFTNISSAVPAQCRGLGPPTTFGSYLLQSLTVRFPGVGTPALTTNPETLPP